MSEEGKDFWVPANNNPRSWTFICSVCLGTVYDVQPTRGKPEVQTKRCKYRFCPHCGHPMEVDA